MNTKERAIKKIANIKKQELSAEKVELSLISEVDAAMDKAISSGKSLAKLAQSLELDAKTAANNYEIVINKGKNAIAKAKELGADDLIRTLSVRVQDAEMSKKEMESIISKVKSFIL
jgi:hypothetical protein